MITVLKKPVLWSLINSKGFYFVALWLAFAAVYGMSLIPLEILKTMDSGPIIGIHVSVVMYRALSVWLFTQVVAILAVLLLGNSLLCHKKLTKVMAGMLVALAVGRVEFYFLQHIFLEFPRDLPANVWFLLGIAELLKWIAYGSVAMSAIVLHKNS